MKKKLDQLTIEELEKVNEFIPFGNRPIKQARILFPNIIGKGSVKTVQNIKTFTWNKLLILTKKKSNEEIEIHLNKCINVIKDIPEYAKEVDLELIK